jgi:hypothetical protein
MMTYRRRFFFFCSLVFNIAFESGGDIELMFTGHAISFYIQSNQLIIDAKNHIQPTIESLSIIFTYNQS